MNVREQLERAQSDKAEVDKELAKRRDALEAMRREDERDERSIMGFVLIAGVCTAAIIILIMRLVGLR